MPGLAEKKSEPSNQTGQWDLKMQPSLQSARNTAA